MPSWTSSSRWCPTPEQLMILEEMYKGGTRTPNAAQIQQITARLSRYGKIEGKNVFYWFQNHKARDRQRLRRKLMSKQFHLHSHQQFQNHNTQSPLGFLEFPPFSYHTPRRFLPQGTGVENGSAQVIGDSVSRMYGGDPMIMLDVGPVTPASHNRPLKTLELFPITATGLRDESAASKQDPFATPTH